MGTTNKPVYPIWKWLKLIFAFCLPSEVSQAVKGKKNGLTHKWLIVLVEVPYGLVEGPCGLVDRSAGRVL